MLSFSYSTFRQLVFKSGILFSAILFCTSIWGQTSLNKNWEKSLSRATGKERVDLLAQLSKELAEENLPLADSLAIEGIELARQMGDSLAMYRIGASLGSIYTQLHKIQEGLDWTQKSLNYFSREESLSFDQAKTQLTLSTFQSRNRDFAKADSLLAESENYFKNTDDVLWQSKVLLTKGAVFQDKLDYQEALNYYTQALEISNQVDDLNYTATLMRSIGTIKRVLGLYPEALELLLQVVSMDCGNANKAKSYHEIGVIYYYLKDWEPAIKYTDLAIEGKRAAGLESSMAYSLYQMGNIQYRRLNFGEALKFMEQSLPIFRKYDLNAKVGDALGIMGNISYDLGDADKANGYYDQQLALAESLNNWEGVWMVHYNRGFYTFGAEKYQEALGHLLKAYEIAKEKGHLPSLLKNHAMLANTYDKLAGEDKNAKFHEEQYYLVEDSIQGLQKIKKIGALEQEYQNKEEEQSEEASTSSDQPPGISPRLLWIGGLILAGILAFFFFRRNTQKSKPIATPAASLDQSKLDEYFQELFTRLDQNKKEAEQTVQKNIPPVNDMADFLKTNLKTPNDWESFVAYFDQVHVDFFKKLKSDYPSITLNELNMCAFLKLNLRNKDIAQIMGIGHDSVRVAQNRLSKKLNLPEGVSLRDFILKI